MTRWILIRRSVRFHLRSHLGTLLGASIASTVLIGALVVGDSVRGSLRDLSRQRLGPTRHALSGGDRFVTQDLPLRMGAGGGTAALVLPATATRQDDTARANHIQLFGVMPPTRVAAALPAAPRRGEVRLNAALAAQLRAGPGDELILRVHKPSALSREVPITPRADSSVALRLKVSDVAPPDEVGDFSLSPRVTAPLNAFMDATELQEATQLQGRANLLLSPGVARDDAQIPGPTASVPGSEATGRLSVLLRRSARLADYEAQARVVPGSNQVELISRRIFLDAPLSREALSAAITSKGSPPAVPILTYLANLLRHGDRTTPYSMVTAVPPGSLAPLPHDLRDDEICINEWLAGDLAAKPGDWIDLSYHVADSGAQLTERTNRFRVRTILPMTGPTADRTLMPEFPGLAKAESTSDWDAGFPLVHKIRDQDEAYWKQYRGTPKAFVTLAAGRRMWGNRFGDLTAVRVPITPEPDFGTAVTNAWSHRLATMSAGPGPQASPGLTWKDFTNELAATRAVPGGWRRTPGEFQAAYIGRLEDRLDPADFGLRFEPVAAQAEAAAAQSQDFGGLFIGFSFFLITAALILMSMLFQFALEQRAAETGTLLALGFVPRQVRRLLLGEGLLLAAIGGGIGVIGGVAYAQAMIHGLTTVWRDAVSTSALRLHVGPLTLAIGFGAGLAVAAITLGLALRRQAARPARALLDGLSDEPAPVPAMRGTGFVQRLRQPEWLASVSGAGAVTMTIVALLGRDGPDPGLFFGAGALLLVAGIAAAAAWLRRLEMATAGDSLESFQTGSLGLRNCARKRSRSLSALGLLACGSFLVASIGVFRLDAVRDAERRTSGTGGFALIGESALPVGGDLNTASGREAFALDDRAMEGVSVVSMRVKDGDEASCLNLNRAQRPRLLGVNPERLGGRFTFARAVKGASLTNGWGLLRQRDDFNGAVPAIGDLNSILWAMGRKVGDVIPYTDDRGREFPVILVGAVANSILQGSLLIDEAELVKRFPSADGHRMFLVDAPSNRATNVAATLSRAMRDVGLELTPAATRLAQFNAVQNTYLGTFQVLGGLGLLLGSAGLGALVLRNVLERRAELAVLLALGFRRSGLRRLLLGEHGALLLAGLGIGLLSAMVAVLPVVVAPGGQPPPVSTMWTLGAVLLSGLLWTWLATAAAIRGPLLDALRNE